MLDIRCCNRVCAGTIKKTFTEALIAWICRNIWFTTICTISQTWIVYCFLGCITNKRNVFFSISKNETKRNKDTANKDFRWHPFWKEMINKWLKRDSTLKHGLNKGFYQHHLNNSLHTSCVIKVPNVDEVLLNGLNKDTSKCGYATVIRKWTAQTWAENQPDAVAKCHGRSGK